jgi:hypothetical protein
MDKKKTGVPPNKFFVRKLIKINLSPGLQFSKGVE